MIPVTDPFMAGAKPSGIQRGRGGFYRSADDSPYVTDPTGEVCKTGDRKGEIKRLKYGSPSNRGREIENDAGLVKYRQRLSFLGIGMDTALAEQCRDLVIMDADSEEFRHAADKIAVEADRLTRSWLAADRGTHGHLLCERADTTQVWADIIPTGQAVGIDTATQDAVVAAWLAMLRDNGLEVVAIEASCVDDRWRLAGTLDRIVRTTRDLTFVKPSGELVVIPENTRLIGDIKFGKVRKAHPIQCASYAQSVPYDTETETRGEWPWEISQEHALIFHGSFDPPSFELVWVDLVAGREHGGETVVQAKAWAARDDVFSVAQLPSDVEGGEEAVTRPSPPSASLVGEGDGPLVSHNTTTVPSPTQSVNDLLPRQGMPQHALDELEVDRLNDARRASYEDWGKPSPDRLALVDARHSLCATPDEGADWSDTDHAPLWDELKGLYDGLDPAARAWRGELASQAKRRGVDFLAQGGRTARRYWINKAVIALAIAGEGDDILRELLAHLVGDVALFPSIEPGHVLGSLGASEAQTFANHVDEYLRTPKDAA